MTGGMIVKGAAGLPQNFAVIEAQGYHEAFRAMKAAFKNPEVTLVVWGNAAEALPDEMQDMIADIVRDGYGSQSYLKLSGTFLRESRFEKRLSDHFNAFARDARLGRGYLKLWRQDTDSIVQALRDEFKVTDHTALLRLERIARNPSYHHDRMGARGVVAFRVLSGDSTEYYRAHDITKVTKRLFSSWPLIEVKQGADIWRVPRGAMAFHSSSILHSAPSVQTSGYLARNQIRLADAHLIWAKNDFVACQMK